MKRVRGGEAVPPGREAAAREEGEAGWGGRVEAAAGEGVLVLVLVGVLVVRGRRVVRRRRRRRGVRGGIFDGVFCGCLGMDVEGGVGSGRMVSDGVFEAWWGYMVGWCTVGISIKEGADRRGF